MSKYEFYVFHNVSSIDLYPVQFGKEQCAPLHHFGPMLTQNYLFHYILAGEGTFHESIPDTTHHLTAGQGFLIPPNTICSYEADELNPWTYCWIEFNGLKVANFLKEAGLTKQNLIFTPKTQAVMDNIMEPLDTIIHNHRQHEAFLIGQLYAFMDRLIQFSKYSQPPRNQDVHNFYIREAINHIERHYMQNLTIQELAAHCNLNQSHLTRLFRQEMGTTPSQFLQHYRLNVAAELLVTTQLSIREISEQVGYANQFNFSAAFKRVKGLAPLQWRSQYH